MPQRHRPELSDAVGGERLVAHRRSARTFAKDRVCAHDDCDTKLSIYNSSNLCGAHAAFRAMLVVDSSFRSLEGGGEERVAS